MTPEQAGQLTTDRANQAVRMLALEALSRIVLRTPVDTGRARGNWNVGVGEADAGFAWDQYDAQGQGTIARGQALLEGAPPGQVLYVTNSIAYILPLEHGHSKQAPAGMVAVTLAELQGIAQQVAVQLRETRDVWSQRFE